MRLSGCDPRNALPPWRKTGEVLGVTPGLWNACMVSNSNRLNAQQAQRIHKWGNFCMSASFLFMPAGRSVTWVGRWAGSWRSGWIGSRYRRWTRRRTRRWRSGWVVSGTVVGVGVPSTPVVGTTVGLEVGVAVVVGTPAVGVVSPPVAGLVFWFCVSVLPALKVALMATPFPSVVTATGSGIFNKPTQFSPLAP